MVEIIAIIRPSKAAATKRKLCEIGHPAFTCVKVNGRGKLPVERVLADGSVIKTGLIPRFSSEAFLFRGYFLIQKII